MTGSFQVPCFPLELFSALMPLPQTDQEQCNGLLSPSHPDTNVINNTTI